jgi:hypothetical protein
MLPKKGVDQVMIYRKTVEGKLPKANF